MGHRWRRCAWAGRHGGLERMRSRYYRRGGPAALLAALLALYAWLSRDTAAPDDAWLSLPAGAEVRPADNAFLKIQSLGVALKELGLTGSARLRELATYDDESRVVADQILGLELVQRLPARLEDILAAPAFQPTVEPATGDASDTLRGALDIERLLRLRMQRQLFLGEREEAWQTAQLGWRFCQLLRGRIGSFHELSLAQASQSSWLEAIAAAIDVSQWSTTQLRALASLPEPAGTPERLLRAVSSEYAVHHQEGDGGGGQDGPEEGDGLRLTFGSTAHREPRARLRPGSAGSPITVCDSGSAGGHHGSPLASRQLPRRTDHKLTTWRTRPHVYERHLVCHAPS